VFNSDGADSKLNHEGMRQALKKVFAQRFHRTTSKNSLERMDETTQLDMI